MLYVPVSDVNSQTLTVTLGGQACTINLYQKSTGFYCDLYVSGGLIVAGVICKNMTKIVRDAYLGFAGDLVFYDVRGNMTPHSPGLGTRFLLAYLELSDLGGAG